MKSFLKANKEEIVEHLYHNPTFEEGYDTAKEFSLKYLEKLSHEEKLCEYIELLNKDYYPILREDELNFSDGSGINFFWKLNRFKIIEKLYTDEMYKEGYEKAKLKVEKWFLENKYDFDGLVKEAVRIKELHK